MAAKKKSAKRARPKRKRALTPSRTKPNVARKEKPLKHDNGKGKGRRTAAQLARQERVFRLSVFECKTVREIAAAEGIHVETVLSDLRHEYDRRSGELEGRREAERARSIAFYEGVTSTAIEKGKMYDGIAKAGGKVVDHTLDAMIKSRERIDKILGIDAPTKIEVGLASLLEALAPPDDK